MSPAKGAATTIGEVIRKGMAPGVRAMMCAQSRSFGKDAWPWDQCFEEGRRGE